MQSVKFGGCPAIKGASGLVVMRASELALIPGMAPALVLANFPGVIPAERLLGRASRSPATRDDTVSRDRPALCLPLAMRLSMRKFARLDFI